MRSFFHLLIALLFGSAAVCNASFIEDLAKPTSWEKTVDVIFRDIPRKTLISRVDAKAIRIPRQDLFKVGDFSHGDVVLRWNDAKKLERVEIIVYNKGDVVLEFFTDADCKTEVTTWAKTDSKFAVSYRMYAHRSCAYTEFMFKAFLVFYGFYVSNYMPPASKNFLISI